MLPRDHVRVSLGSILILALVFSHPVVAQSPDLTTDMLLARWEMAARSHWSIDAVFERLDQSRLQNETRRGRFYWEGPDSGYYRAGNDRFVWGNGTLRAFDLARGTYLQFSRPQLESMANHLVEFGGRERKSRWAVFVALWGYYRTPREAIPLMAEMTAEGVRARFAITWQRREDGILVTLIPKDPIDVGHYRQIEVILDAGSYEMTAHRMITKDGCDVVHLFKRVSFDAYPQDRDALLQPDVAAFDLIRWPFEAGSAAP